MMRVLAVDPGDVRIGLAISDPLGLIARPLLVITHTRRFDDAQRIVDLALEHEVGSILVGVPYDQKGEIGPQARKSLRLADEIQSKTELPVITWDESGSTNKAIKSKSDDGLLDAHAAAFILQDYLDVQSS